MRSVDRIGQRAEESALRIQPLDHLQQMRERPCQAVDAHDNQRVAFAYPLQYARKNGPCSVAARGLFLVDLNAALGFQGLRLGQGGRLIASHFARPFFWRKADIHRRSAQLDVEAGRDTFAGAGSSSRSKPWSPHDWRSRVGLPMSDPHSAEESAVHPPARKARPTSRQGRSGALTSRALSLCFQAVGFMPRSNSVPSLSIACIVTASFLASATAARLKPMRSLSFNPQLRRSLSAELRVRMTDAAS